MLLSRSVPSGPNLISYRVTVSGHVILADSRSITTVRRSTYAAELLSATTATDIAIPLTVTLYEIRFGPLGTERLRSIRG